MDGHIIIGTELDTKSFEKEIASLEAKLSDIEASLQMAKEDKTLFSTSEIQEMEKEAEKLNNRLIDLRKKQSEIGKTDLSGINSTLSNIGNSVENVTKKVGRWALAVFGIRSAYMFVRQAMSTLSQYNDQIATDVEYIRYALATTLQPIIEYIIKLVYQLLGLIGSIAKAWFGVDIFANASAKAFNKNAKAISGANKNAKELQKTLTGFDKLNILQDNGSTSIGGGGGGVGSLAPSIDLSQIEDADLSGIIRFLDKIKDLFNKVFDKIVSNVKKVLIDLGASPEFIKAWEKTVESFRKTFEGVIDFIVGLVKALIGLLTGDTDLVTEGIKQAITGIKEFVLGLFNFIISIQSMTITAIKDGLIALFNKIPEKLKAIKDKIVDIFKNMGTAVGEYVGNAFKKVINAVLARVETTLNKPISAINALVGVINNIPGISIGKLQNFKLPRLAKGGIINMPGRGVDYYGANIGERGREGVVPLDNEASLRIIGETIAKYTKFNADITLELESRILAKVIKEINSDKQFARNGG